MAAKVTIVDISKDTAAPASGGSALALTLGTGAITDDQLMFGVHTGDYSWVQAIKPGTAYRNLILQGGGGNVGIGTSSPSTTLHVAGPVRMQSYTVGTLPSASGSGAGARAFVTDALVPVFGSTVANGGAAFTPVYSDGTNWKVG